MLGRNTFGHYVQQLSSSWCDISWTFRQPVKKFVYLWRRLMTASHDQLMFSDVWTLLVWNRFILGKSRAMLIFWAASWQNLQNGMCAQRKLRSAWASAQSDQSLPFPYERSLGPLLPIEHSAKTDLTGRMPRLIWVFAGCTVIWSVLTCGGSFSLTDGIAAVHLQWTG